MSAKFPRGGAGPFLARSLYVFIDLDVASFDDDVMNAHGLTLFQIVRNVS